MWGLALKIETRKFQEGSWKSIIFMSIFKYVQNWWFQIIHQVSYKKIFEQGDKLNAEKRKTTPLCFFIIIPLDDFSLQVYSCFIGEVWQRPPNLISENPFVAGKRSQMKSTYGPHYTGKGLQFFFFLSVSHQWETHSDSTYVELQKELHDLFDTGWFIGPWHSCKCLCRGQEEAFAGNGWSPQNNIPGPNENR